MKGATNILLVLAGAMVILGACEEIQSYPETPSVKYKPPFRFFQGTDPLGNEIILGKLSFEFTDGDGNLGLFQPDSANLPDSLVYNLYLNIYEKEGDEFVRDDEVENLNFRIPYIEREGQNKTLTGTITLDLEYKTFEYDTIFYTFYIVDRDFNKSNIDSTEVLVFTSLRDSLLN